MFLSALTESPMIAYISTFAILLVLYLWEGILGFLPTSAAGCMAGVILILSVVVFYIWRMTSNWILSTVLEGGCRNWKCGALHLEIRLFENLRLRSSEGLR